MKVQITAETGGFLLISESPEDLEFLSNLNSNAWHGALIEGTKYAEYLPIKLGNVYTK